MAEINSLAQAGDVIEEMQPGSVLYAGRQIGVELLTVDDFNRFAAVLETVAQGGAQAGLLVRFGSEILKQAVRCGCPALTAEEVGAMSWRTTYEFLRRIAWVNWKVDLNDFLSAGKLLELADRWLPAMPPSATRPEPSPSANSESAGPSLEIAATTASGS